MFSSLQAVVCFLIHIWECYIIKKQREIKWLRLKQNWLQSEAMPLIKKTGQKLQENGKLLQNEESQNHCIIPVQVTEITEKKASQHSKLEQVEDKQNKNFELT